MRSAAFALFGCAALALICFVLMQVWTVPRILAEADGQELFDLRDQGYSHKQATDFIDLLGTTARKTYLGPQRWLDTGFPIGLAGFLALGVYLGLREKFGRWALAGALLPAAFFYADMLENAAVAGMLRSGAPTPEKVELASTYTQLKFQLVYASILLLLLCLIGQVVKWTLARFKEHQ